MFAVGSLPSSALASEAAASSVPWWKDLPNTLVDKGLLAIIIAWAGFSFNKALDRLKSEESLSSGITDERLKKVGEMSEAAYEWEAEVFREIEQLRRKVGRLPVIAQSQPVQEFAKKRNELAAKGHACLSTLAKNRFWVGDGLYDNFSQLYTRVAAALEGVVDVSSLEACDVVLKDAHVNATGAMKTFIQDHVRMRAWWNAASKNAATATRRSLFVNPFALHTYTVTKRDVD